jgi:hypothetical protein
VATYSDEDLPRVAAELPEDVAKRKQLRDLYDNLAESLRVFVVYESDVLKRCCPRQDVIAPLGSSIQLPGLRYLTSPIIGFLHFQVDCRNCVQNNVLSNASYRQATL